MTDDESGVTIVFNGCIYNHAELRAELSGRSRFRSTSDTEVMLKAYAAWGDDFVDHLVGMFAFAIVDPRRDRVLLGRDRLGIKPLYVAALPGRLRFASTLPALLAGGGIDTGFDRAGLRDYLHWHSIVPAPRTVLRGVQKLPPATLRVVTPDGHWEDRVYWRADYRRDPARADWTADDWVDAVHTALRTAVERRLTADVPVGVLLSGGLDSSLLVALLAELGRSEHDTFSIGFDGVGGERGDEFRYSDLVAERFGTRHHRIHVPPSELIAAVEDKTEPMATPDVTAFHLLAREVSRVVKVVQCGQGSDEIFAGYDYHRRAADAGGDDAAAGFRAAFDDPDAVELLVPELRPIDEPEPGRLDRHLGRPGADARLDAVLRLDTEVLMPDDPVKRVDSMTMAFGVEARVPFLDHDLVELAASCPPELKAADSGKGVLKALGRRLLPREVIDRPKGYFPVPAFRRLEGAALDLVRDVANAVAGWYDDGTGRQRWWDGEQWADKWQEPEPVSTPAGLIEHIRSDAVSGGQPRPAAAGMSYVVLQVVLKEKLWGTGSGNLTELEKAINAQASLGYRLHTITTAASGSKGMGGGDRIQATMVFERLS
jgi:asparagine synthase (glutamine-hydrolysing)